MASQSINQLPILILGAGISGLALAQGLLRANIPFHIYERDPTFNQRTQGYRVRIAGLGVSALKDLIPDELYPRLELSCAAHVNGGNSIDALTGQKLPKPEGMGRPENPGGPDIMAKPLNADRTVLRDVLIRGLDSYVTFGKEFVRYETVEDGVLAHFADSTAIKGSLLVGADGAGSRVRKQHVPDLRLWDTEGRLFYGKSPLTAELLEKMDPRAMSSMSIIKDLTEDGKPLSLFMEPIRFQQSNLRGDLPDDYVYWVLNARKGLHGMSDDELLHLSNSEAAALAIKTTAHWKPEFRPVFEMQDMSKTACLRIITVKPDLPAWTPSPRVTLIGDAAHVMSPTAGIGATTALRDSAALARILREEGVTREGIGRYEDGMRETARDAVLKSQMGGKHLFGMRGFDGMEEVS